MPEATFASHELSYDILTKDNLPADFGCGVEDLNEFLLEDALVHAEQKVATTTLVYHSDRVVAFFSLCSDAIRLSTKEKAKILGEYPKLK